MINIISIPKSAAILMVVISAFFSTYANAENTPHDNSVSSFGCDQHVSINDFL